MRTTKVYEILKASDNLTRVSQIRFDSETHIFLVHHQVTNKVLFVRMVKKTDAPDWINDVNNTVIIKTLKDLKMRLVK